MYFDYLQINKNILSSESLHNKIFTESEGQNDWKGKTGFLAHDKFVGKEDHPFPVLWKRNLNTFCIVPIL